jgi:hypothetical protein
MYKWVKEAKGGLIGMPFYTSYRLQPIRKGAKSIYFDVTSDESQGVLSVSENFRQNSRGWKGLNTFRERSKTGRRTVCAILS